jgi:HEPN domain
VGISASKTVLIDQLFVRTADENYITARWCETNDLTTDFLWLALHALEKYMKAVLLANGQTSVGDGHDIVELYKKVKLFGCNLLPDTLPAPAGFNPAHWVDRSPDKFIADLLSNGNADNRYSIFGYSKQVEDIHMLDAMVFAIRRLICPLDESIFKRSGGPKITHRERLTQNPKYLGHENMPLNHQISATKDSEKRTAALNRNFAFAPSDYQHVSMRYSGSTRNPAIGYRVVEPLVSDSADTAKDAIAVAEWLLENVKIPNNEKMKINDAVTAARARHNIPHS